MIMRSCVFYEVIATVMFLLLLWTTKCRIVITVLNLDNSFGDWRDCRKKVWNEWVNGLDEWNRMKKKIRIYSKLTNGSGNFWTIFFLKYFYEVQWHNKATNDYHWLLTSWENWASKPNHTVAIIENVPEIAWSYPVLRIMVHALSILRAWLVVFL